MPTGSSSVPQDVLASWPEPDYENPLRRTWLPAVTLPLTILATALAAIRFWLRCRGKGGGFGVDDAFLLPACVINIGFTALAVYASERGLVDRHVWDQRPRDLEENSLNAWIAIYFFVIGTSLLKIAVLLFHRRVVGTNFPRKWKWAVIGAVVFTVAICTILIFSIIFHCSPAIAYWKRFDPTWDHNFSCRDTTELHLLAGVSSAISDLYSVVLPCIMLAHLPITRRQKFGLNALFCLGLAVVATACVRTYVLSRWSSSYDATWIGFDVYLTSTIEYNLGIVCACIPSLRVFFQRYLKDRLTSSFNLSRTPPRNAHPPAHAHGHPTTTSTFTTSDFPSPGKGGKVHSFASFASAAPFSRIDEVADTSPSKPHDEPYQLDDVPLSPLPPLARADTREGRGAARIRNPEDYVRFERDVLEESRGSMFGSRKGRDRGTREGVEFG